MISSGIVPGAAMADGAGASMPDRTASGLADAAREFEALLLAQILKSARQASSWGLAGETDAAGGCAMEYAEEQLAALLAQRGGLGIANILVAGLTKEQSAPGELRNPSADRP